MGRIKTKLIKRTTKELLRLHPDDFAPDFEQNKAVVSKYAEISSKKLRNTIAGYAARIVKKRAQKK